MQAIVLKSPGGSFKIKKVEDQKPKKDEVLIKQTAIGINFYDVCFRRGQFKLSKVPAILGMEACGIIEAVGEGVIDYRVGERVAYATGGIGAYTEKRVINQHHLVIPPKELNDVQVAGCLLKGLMAHTLLHRVYIAARVKKVLIHAAAGGLGHLMCQWAKHLGLEVFGTVGSDEKISFARGLGCDHVINYRTKNFVEEISNITNNSGVALVYDSVGKDTLEKSLECLLEMGMCVSFGESSGTAEKLDLNRLLLNSLYITRPTLALYKANRIELVLAANEVFAALTKGILKPKITTYPFQDVEKAHKDLESRKTMGSLVLVV
jgi:NADPH2:quinone reductase